MKASLSASTSLSQCWSHYLSAAWPAGLVALALAPTGASATVFTIGSGCVLISPPAACLASNLSNKASNSIAFAGGVLTMDATGQTYVLTPVTLDTSAGNTINQAGHDNTFNGVFQDASTGGNIKITNVDPTTGNPLTAGSVTVTKSNTYTGTTTVDSGATLKLSGAGRINSSALKDNGTFDASGANGNFSLTDLSGTNATATVILGTRTMTLTAAGSLFPAGFAGGISGTGGLTVNGGTETLSGNNSYTGITTIGTNGTLAISGAGSIASSSKVTDNGVFDISKAIGDVKITSLSGSGNVKLGGNSVILTNASDTFSGVISGTGGLTVNGGTEKISGSNSYAGITTIGLTTGTTAATLAITGAGSIATSSNVNVTKNGVFDTSKASGNVTIASLSGAAGASVTLGNNQTLSLSNASGIFSGVIGGGNPNTGLTIAGGKEALMGANTFKGSTTVSPGATLTGTGSIAGSLINNGTVRPFDTVSNKAGTFTVGGAYTPGTGGILDIAIGSTPGVGNYSKLVVAGKATLTGSTLDVDTFNSFQFPLGTSTYTSILKYGSKTGDFKGVSFNDVACNPDGTDKWSCDAGLATFTEIFNANTNTLDLLVAQTPEPGTLAILASGLLGLFGLRRRWTRPSG